MALSFIGRGRRPRLRLLAVIAVPVLLGHVAWTAVVRPSHDREWQPEHARMPRIEFTTDDSVRIHDVRNFRYDQAGQPIPAYEARSYDLGQLETVWFVVTPFEREWRGPAHAFLSFGFADSQFVAVSVEARRELGEAYSMAGGMLRRYELIYVIGDERDLIGNRALVQKDDVYVYPIRTTPAQARALFDDVLARVNELYDSPEFYGTIRNNCTTAILDHVNSIASRTIRWGPRVLLPGYSDALALELGLIDTSLPIDAARERFRVDTVAARAASDGSFGVAIRDR